MPSKEDLLHKRMRDESRQKKTVLTAIRLDVPAGGRHAEMRMRHSEASAGTQSQRGGVC